MIFIISLFSHVFFTVIGLASTSATTFFNWINLKSVEHARPSPGTVFPIVNALTPRVNGHAQALSVRA